VSGKNYDVTYVNSELGIMDDLSKSETLATYKVNVNGLNVSFNFLDGNILGDTGETELSKKDKVVTVDFQDSNYRINRILQRINKPQNVDERFVGRTYLGSSLGKIVTSYFKDAAYHEFIHSLTSQKIESGFFDINFDNNPTLKKGLDEVAKARETNLRS
jgi:hypothetical protein